ncbi:YetF domain-containing protein [Halotia wernerae UHCC 0503]|nr:YetF domain-containing protein [Halotia wernerae UHCC 0503]
MIENPFINTIILGTIAYVAIIFMLRISGKRTLAKWNSFDFVVTISFGSILSSILLSTKDTFGTGILSFGLLVLFQYVLTWISVRSSLVQKLVKAEPALLLYKGKLKQDVLKRERIAEGEVLAALRSNGVGAIEGADAVVLETDGSFSVIKDLSNSTASALKDVKEFDRSTTAHT